MEFFIRAKPNAKKEAVEQIDEAHFVVRVIETPEGGKANKAIIKILAEYLKAAPSRFMVIKGQTSRDKIIQFD